MSSNPPTPSEPLQCVRFHSPPELLLMAASCGTPLCIHATNWMAGLCSVTPLGEMVGDDTGKQVFFPEQGLHLALDEIEEIHGIELDTGAGLTSSVEFAILGEPRALSIAALPNFGDTALFRKRLHRQPVTILEPGVYQQWSTGFARPPAMCPCCADAAEQRRATPGNHPLARILLHAAHQAMPLRCGILSPAYGYTTWLTPCALGFDGGRIDLSDTNGAALLEIDPGICHSLSITRRRPDGERYSMMELFDPRGNGCLEISTPGWDAEKIWRSFCAAPA